LVLIISQLQAIAAIVMIKLGDVVSRYDGTDDFAEWVAKFELVARLQKLENLEAVMPMFLSGGAFVVYEGLAESAKRKYSELKHALEKAFCLDRVAAFSELCRRRLADNESVDVFIADVKRLVRVIDANVCEEWVKSAVIVGLPMAVHQ